MFPNSAYGYGAYMHAQHVLEQQELAAEQQRQPHSHLQLQLPQHQQLKPSPIDVQDGVMPMSGVLNFGPVKIPIPAAAGAGAGRKRKANDEEDVHDGFAGNLAERRKLSLPRCMPGTMDQEAKFHPLPEDLNRQMLAGLNMLPGQGNAAALYKTLQLASQQQSTPIVFPGSSHSPSSPASELPPGTPCDGFFGSRTLANNGGVAYPDFALYPAAGSSSDATSTSRSRIDSSASGSSSAQSTAFGIFEPAIGAMPESCGGSTEDGKGMCVDGFPAGGAADGSRAWDASMPSYPPPPPQGHGPHCKSIPQLSVRHYDGARSELWATCTDCGASTRVQESQPATGMCYSP
ncbi:hypothetical protein K437DRAFT_8617 [Tilletiaria anomala UBC 951]|uniref:Uncharacterized protein n=1 Tax=Tilletiaria anomala (strain ATCC 24038 / CBS 436.72 / UBC 951) TaxID=1037660 RepID=A0A066VD46_TILAU|nr:uncharacterized protein K437DRAFT_8617 [Tilletiaria anomala UBC 951]KDN39677.1 hypothetical protein K437DRAFT_8617 [Tilletiaria anomala UBC 951]